MGGYIEPQQQVQAVIEIPQPDSRDIPKEIMESIGNYVGWWVVLGIFIVGVAVIFRRRIAAGMKAFLKNA